VVVMVEEYDEQREALLICHCPAFSEPAEMARFFISKI
jgi:hypothetical protein